MISHRKADGAVTTTTYSNLNLHDYQSTSPGTEFTDWTYDALGRLTAHENQDVTLNYTYVSGSNRKATEITVVKGLGNLTRTTALGYDASARLNGFYRGNVFNVAFTHASNGLIGTVTNDSPPPLAQYAYDSGGLVQAIALENGLTTTWSRDLAGQPLGVLTKDATNTVISGVTHTLDAATRRKSATYEDNLGQAYAYDVASQVTHGKVNIANAANATATAGPTHAYTYDPAGNRNSSLAFGQSTSYTANNVNAYTAISGGCFQPPSPTYDAKGNTLSLPRADGTTHGLTWDSQDRLRIVTPSGSTAHSMVYDPLGRLVWSRRPDGLNPAIDEIWSWSSWTLLAREVFQSSTLVETFRYTWGPDLSGSLEGAGGVSGLLAIERAAGGSTAWDIRHAHADANGNILSLTTGSGVASARYRYSPFGETISSQDLDGSGWAVKNLHRFSTKPEITGTGLLYYEYRFYDPQTGRWPSRDPIGEEGGVNMYQFVYNSVNRLQDFLGLSSTQDTVLVKFGHNYEHKEFVENGGCDYYNGVVFVGCSANYLNDGPGVDLPFGWDNFEFYDNGAGGESETYPDADTTDWLSEDYQEEALEADIDSAKNEAESLCSPPNICKTYVKVDCGDSNPFVSDDPNSWSEVAQENCGKTYSYDCEKQEWK